MARDDWPVRWRVAMERALYRPGGFFVAGAGPSVHFRTSAHASPLFAGAILRLVSRVDEALGRPAELDLVDVGAGRGELLRAVLGVAPDGLRERLRPRAVELAGRPADLPAGIGWSDRQDRPVHGLLIATEWLDNVPLDVAYRDDDGVVRYLLVDRDGVETVGPPVDRPDAAWLDRWWPLHRGDRAEIGVSRDAAWRQATSTVDKGLALTVDYGHFRHDRPAGGTLTGYRDGREALAVPDGASDLTAAVALDAVADGAEALLVPQREALAALGVSGRRPPLDLASSDPAGYLRALAAASHAAELTEPAGLGGHWWLLQPVGLPLGAVWRD